MNMSANWGMPAIIGDWRGFTNGFPLVQLERVAQEASQN
jgi:hypothetical protein